MCIYIYIYTHNIKYRANMAWFTPRVSLYYASVGEIRAT